MLKSWHVSLGFLTIFDPPDRTKRPGSVTRRGCSPLPTDFCVIIICKPNRLWRIFGQNW